MTDLIKCITFLIQNRNFNFYLFFVGYMLNTHFSLSHGLSLSTLFSHPNNKYIETNPCFYYSLFYVVLLSQKLSQFTLSAFS